MKAKKKNPTYTLKRSDIDRIKKECTNDAVNAAFAIFLTVMRDKWGFGHKRLNRLYGQILDLSETIGEGYISIDKLRQILRDEAGVIVGVLK